MLKLRNVLILSAGLLAAGLAGSATAGASPAPTQPYSITPAAAPVSTQGIIMKDGSICNPRWGC